MSEIVHDEELVAHLVGQLHSRIKSFDSSAKWYRWRYWFAGMLAGVISTIIAILAGWKPPPKLGVDVSNLILCLGATATLVSLWGSFFSPAESWLLYARTLNSLRALKASVEFRVAGAPNVPITKDEVGAWFKEYQSILDAHNAGWLGIRSKANQN